METRRLISALAGVLATSSLAGCGGGEAASGAPEPTPEPASPTQTAFADQQGAWDLVLTGVEATPDQVALDFDGTGTPGWAVSWVDEAVVEGSGKVVDVDGDAILQISASGTTYPANTGDGYDGPQRISPDSGPVAEVYVVGTWEGYTQVFVGVEGDAVPFEVAGEPGHLAVDLTG